MEIQFSEKAKIAENGVAKINAVNGRSFQTYRTVAVHPVRPYRLAMAEDEEGNPVPRCCAVIDNINRVIDCGHMIFLVCEGDSWNCVPKFSLDGGITELSLSAMTDEEITLAYRKMIDASGKFPSGIRTLADAASEIVGDYLDVFGRFDERPRRPEYWLKIFLNLVGRKINLNDD